MKKGYGVGIVAFIDMLHIISILMLVISSLMFEKTLYTILTVIPAFCFGVVAYDVKRGSEQFKGKDLFINTDELKFTLLYDIKKDSSLISYYHVCRMRLKFIIDVVFILLMIPYTLFYFIFNDYMIIELIILCVISFISLIIWLSLPKIFPKFAVKKDPRYINMDYKDCLK